MKIKICRKIITAWNKINVKFKLAVKIDGIHHGVDVKTKVQAKMKVLKALAGSDWDKEKKTIVNTYKTIGRPLLNYYCNMDTRFTCHLLARFASSIKCCSQNFHPLPSHE